MLTVTSEQPALDESTYNRLRKRIDEFNAWINSRRQGKRGWASYRLEEIPTRLLPAPTNDERSAVERYEFIRDKPDQLFAYVNESERIVTTWTGDSLGTCTLGFPYLSGFGRSTRQSIEVSAINGETYRGTYFTSSGNYCRLRRVNKQR